MKRFTLDLDFKDEFLLGQTLTKILIKVEKVKFIDVKRSYKKGWHMIIWTTKRYTVKEIFSLREFLGDDKTRVRLDKKRRFARDTLFYKKEKIVTSKTYTEKPLGVKKGVVREVTGSSSPFHSRHSRGKK